MMPILKAGNVFQQQWRKWWRRQQRDEQWRRWWRRRRADPRQQQEGAPTDPVHQQRVRFAARLHPQRAVRHQAVQDQDAALGHLLHQLPDAGPVVRRHQRRHGRVQGRHTQTVERKVRGTEEDRAGREIIFIDHFTSFNQVEDKHFMVELDITSFIRTEFCAFFILLNPT